MGSFKILLGITVCIGNCSKLRDFSNKIKQALYLGGLEPD